MADRRLTLSSQDCDVLADWLAPLVRNVPGPVRPILALIFEESSQVKGHLVSARKSGGRKSAEAVRPWLTSAEVAGLLGVGDRRVRQLCRGSALPIARGPEGWRIPPDVIDVWRADGVGQ